MPIPGDVYRVNGYVLGSGPLADVEAIVSELSEPIKADPQHLDRSGNPPEFVQSGVDATAIDVPFKVLDYSAKAALLAALDYPTTEAPIELQVYKGNDASPTLCTADVAIRQLQIGPSEVRVSFDKSDPAWRAVAVHELGRTMNFGASAAATLINKGHVRAPSFLKLGWITQRATESSAIGWKYRRQVPITNNTTEDWADELVSVDMGDTAAWVTATEAQADGDDVRVWYQGKEVYRTLTNFNTLKSLIHFLVTIKAGATATYDIVYGNLTANSPRTLSTKALTRKTYAAPDLEGDSGTATAGTTTTMTDSGAAWETNRWRGGWIGFLSGTGSVRWRRILSNTGTVITLNRAVVTAPAAGTTYVIFMAGVMFDGGRVTGGVTSTAVQDTAHTRKWGVNSLTGATVTFTGASTAVPLVNTVRSNTADTITFDTTFSVNPSVNDQFTIQMQGVWSYVVDTTLDDTVHRGLYRSNQYYSPPTRIWPNGDTPAGWQLETRLPNDDDFGVYPPYNIGSSGGHSANYWPNMRVYRRMKQDTTFIGEGTGDGYSLFSGFGFQGWYFDYYWRNINGVGQAVFAAMDAGGQDWQDLVTDTTTQATLIAVAAQHVDLTGSNFPTRLYMGALPADGVEIDGGQADQIELRTYQNLEVYHNLESFGGLTDSVYVLGSAVECYQLECSLRIGGGRDAERVGPFYELVIGGGGHYVMLPDTYELWIATDPGPGQPLFGIYSSTGALISEAAWAGRFYRYEPGETTGVQAREFTPIPPAINLITNGYFGSTITGWGAPVLSSGVSATAGWVATPDAGDGIGAGSMEIDITVTPVGAWTIRIPWPTLTVTPNKNYPVGFAYRATNIGSSLKAELEAVWEGAVGNDPTMLLGGAPAAINTWYYDADDELTFYVAPGLVSAYQSTETLDLTILISGTGSYVGKVYVDQVTVGVTNLHVEQDEPGTAYLKASFQEGYLA